MKNMTSKNIMSILNDYIQKFIDSSIEKYEEFDIENFSTVWLNKKNQNKLQKLIESKILVGKSSSGKKTKDLNKPKSARSAYLYFCNENRQKIRDDNPDLKITEITKILANQWNELNEKAKTNTNSEKQLKKYKQLAINDKQRANEEMSNYIKPSDKKLSTKMTKKHKSSDEKLSTKDKTKNDDKINQNDMNIIENNINNISNISIYVEEDEIVINYKTTNDTDNEIKIPLDENDESDRLDSLHNWVKEWIPKMKNLKTFKYNTQFVNELDIDFLNISPPPKLNTVYLPSMSELPFKFLDGVKTLHITGQLTEDHLELFDHIPRSVKTVTTSGYDVEKDEIKQWPFKLILE